MKNIKSFILLLIAILSITLTACNKTNNTNNNSLENTKIYKIMTDSMKWSDEYPLLSEWENYEIKGFENGDIIVVSTKYDELKVGDVITYTFIINGSDQKMTYTSRIVDILSDSSTYVVEDDRIAQQYPYRKGDLAYTYELDCSEKIRYVNSDKIIGKVIEVMYKN